MAEISERLKRSLERNLDELSNCVLKRRVLEALSEVDSYHPLDFFRVATDALENDVIAHAIRVFDRHKDVASYWYIQRQLEKEMVKAAQLAELSLERIESESVKLSHIRDKTHFHIDKKAVENPRVIWEEANISGGELAEITENAHEVLRRVYLSLFQEDRPIPNYHGEDVEKIIRAYAAAHPESGVAI